jgi:hypothetical protein
MGAGNKTMVALPALLKNASFSAQTKQVAIDWD